MTKEILWQFTVGMGMKFKRKVAAALATAFAAVGITLFGVAAPASAMSQSDYNLVCQWQYGKAGAHAVSQGNAYQWQCYVSGIQLGGLNLYGYCVNVMGGSNVQLGNVNDPYSWHCV